MKTSATASDHAAAAYQRRINRAEWTGGHIASGACGHRYARCMRHAKEPDLDRLETLLAELRRIPELRERKRGSFSRGSQAFLHFHADAGDLYVDVRLDTSFERMTVTSGEEQKAFLARVQQALGRASAIVARSDRDSG